MPIEQIFNNNFDLGIDIVMCIDATGSMQWVVDGIKENALSFYRKLVAKAEENGSAVAKVRVKIIVFRDYAFDAEPMMESRFFTMDEDFDELYAFLGGIKARGGGDLPENALEALALAVKSDWSRECRRRRHAIIMWTDAPALALGERSGEELYPSDMPKDMGELEELWKEMMDKRAKRLIVFAPNAEPWHGIEDWESVLYQERFTNYTRGVDIEPDIDTCVWAILNTIG